MRNTVPVVSEVGFDQGLQDRSRGRGTKFFDVNLKQSFDDVESGDDSGSDWPSLRKFMKFVFSNKDAKFLFVFCILRLFFTGVTILYSSWSHSLGLLAISFHQLFDSFGQLINLFVNVIAHHPPTETYSFGLERTEVLAGFSNAIFIIFVSLYIYFEALERYFDPHGAEGTPILVISVLGFIFNCISIFNFVEYSHRRAEIKDSQHIHMLDTRISIVIDNLSYLIMIMSALAILSGYDIADPISAVLTSTLSLSVALPHAKDTGRILLQTTPRTRYHKFYNALDKILQIPGVIEYYKEHFWTYSPGVFVATVHVRITPDIESEMILQSINQLLSPLVTHLTVQLEQENHSAFVNDSQSISLTHGTNTSQHHAYDHGHGHDHGHSHDHAHGHKHGHGHEHGHEH